MSIKQLRIKNLFNEQYTLWIESNMMAINAEMKSKTQIRWDFTVLSITDDLIEIKLILLDQTLLESNNPLIKEIAQITKVFSRMYSELHLNISHQGKVIEVLNMETIKAKWAQTKTEIEKISQNNPDLKNVISLNDSIFQDSENLTRSIQTNEFFTVYFNYLFGNDLPFVKNDVSKYNFFNSANVQWQCKVDSPTLLPTHATSMIVNLKMKPFVTLGAGFYNKAYNQFANQIDISKLKTTLSEIGIYNVNPQDGRVIEATLHREEVADDKQLYSKLKYTFMSENVFLSSLKNKETQVKQQQLQNNSEQKQQESQKQQKPYMVYEGKSFFTKEEWDEFEKKKYEEFVKERERKKNNFF
jgi:hypothetical protein